MRTIPCTLPYVISVGMLCLVLLLPGCGQEEDDVMALPPPTGNVTEENAAYPSPATPPAYLQPSAAFSPVPSDTPGQEPSQISDAPKSAPTPGGEVSSMPTKSLSPSLSPTPSATPGTASDIETVKVAEGFSYSTLDETLKARITGMSYPAKGEETKIGYDDLRYIRLLHYDFEGSVHEGELIVHRKLAREVTEIFYKLYEAKYPLASVRLVDDYGEPGDDNLSMAANNTSAFNYRRVTGSKTLSRHSYGAAIDINPVYNPYINGDRVAPPNAAPYVDRTQYFPGKIDHDDLCYKLFTKAGWSWGGDFKGDKDYQHFSKQLD